MSPSSRPPSPGDGGHGPSIRVLHRGRELLAADGRWLWPLFELEARIAGLGVPPAELRVEDRVVGRAAALLLVGLGVGEVHGHTTSRRALPVLERFGIACSWGVLVDRIACRTEELLADEWDPGRARRLLRRRAGLE